MPPRPGRAKVKSGCGTCRTRRIKCDEIYPVCCQCLRTGRLCEGYGVWGGGGNHYGHRSIDPDNRGSLKGFYSTELVDSVTKEDSRDLEWFTHRTALKLPGAFRFAFWDSLLFQAVSNEPAVLHAVLALSSVHRQDTLPIGSSSLGPVPDERERLMLQHYSKAITHLQPHFSSKKHTSIRVALITCLVFVMTDFFRGHYQSGFAHLQTGLRLLNECQARSNAVDCYSLFLEPCRDSIDAWIIQAFIRLDVQAKFLGHGTQYLNIVLEDFASDIPSPDFTFQSSSQARQHLDRLFSQIFYLGDEHRRQLQSQSQTHPSTGFLLRQQHIKTRLASWYTAMKASSACLRPKQINPDSIGYAILRLYYTMAEIMIDTCLSPTDQSKYDAHSQGFDSMMSQIRYLKQCTCSEALFGVMHFSDMSSSVADLGAFPAIFYIAVKCRVRRIRRDAINVLGNLNHKEGMWNGPLIACIAREVAKIEEADFYDNDPIASCDDYGVTDPQSVLPESYRIHDVEVELPKDYGGIVTLRCKRGLDGCNSEVIIREYVYDIGTQSWVR
ncbi:hypothetical protein GGR54DRAFT_637448 [Hypoxylon sp. NC1633]|nr:hypothetical protein GGR54DRAFT_637448 [Hypoxylon sp. NC1633]